VTNNGDIQIFLLKSIYEYLNRPIASKNVSSAVTSHYSSQCLEIEVHSTPSVIGGIRVIGEIPAKSSIDPLHSRKYMTTIATLTKNTFIKCARHTVSTNDFTTAAPINLMTTPKDGYCATTKDFARDFTAKTKRVAKHRMIRPKMLTRAENAMKARVGECREASQPAGESVDRACSNVTKHIIPSECRETGTEGGQNIGWDHLKDTFMARDILAWKVQKKNSTKNAVESRSKVQ